MAPDITSISTNGHTDGAGYNTGNSSNAQSGGEYKIPDITYYSFQNRKIKVLTIGAGVSGILMAYQIQKHCENVEHVIYEKNEDIGGTWLENRYPGCGCDRTCHAYAFNFALNPDWPRFFSYSPDIWKYLDKVCNTFDLRKYMTFNTEVVGCWWQEGAGQWKVKLRQMRPDGETWEFEETCDLLLHATGVLNNFKWPDIEGIEKFKGRMVHTARWPEDYQQEQWKNDRVAVIGSGASSIQTVPNMQPYTKHLDVFVRTGVWFVQIANNFGQNKEYSQEERDHFRHDKSAIVAHAKDIEDQINSLWEMMFTASEVQQKSQEMFRSRMAEFIKDKRLLDGFTPEWSIGCRRITPGDPYMEAIQKPNVDVHFTPVTKITEDSVIGADDIERKVDTVVCATGFDVTYRPRFPVVGLHNEDLASKWKICPESYLGLTIPGFPNFITYIGPTWPVENGSVMGPLGSVADYALQVIKKMQGEGIKSFHPKQDVTDAFNAHVQEFVTHTVWKEECRSWYKNNETGRVNAIWPGSSLHYMEVIEHPRWEDYEIEYGGGDGALREGKNNMWAHLGLGFTVANRTTGANLSPYLNEEATDPKWLEAVGHRAS